MHLQTESEIDFGISQLFVQWHFGENGNRKKRTKNSYEQFVPSRKELLRFLSSKRNRHGIHGLPGFPRTFMIYLTLVNFRISKLFYLFNAKLNPF